MTNADVSLKTLHVFCFKHIFDQTVRLTQTETIAFYGTNTSGILATMLQYR